MLLMYMHDGHNIAKYNIFITDCGGAWGIGLRGAGLMRGAGETDARAAV